MLTQIFGLHESLKLYPVFAFCSVPPPPHIKTKTKLLHNLLPWRGDVWSINESSPEVTRDGPAVDTIRGVAFLHLHGKDLREAWDWVKRFMHTKREADILQVIGWRVSLLQMIGWGVLLLQMIS